MIQSALAENVSTIDRNLHIAFELSDAKWKLGCSDGVCSKLKIINIDAGDLEQLAVAIERARKHFRLPSSGGIYSCYEAGRDGFWLHRYLLSIGIDNIVIDPSSIEVNRRKRRAKTDKLDVRKMMSMLLRHLSGERGVFSLVRVPAPEIEDLRRINRELDCLKHERTMHTNRIGSLLILHNIRKVTVNAQFPSLLDKLTDYEDRPLPPHLKEELLREHERWLLIHRQVLELERSRRKMIGKDDKPLMDLVRQLASLRGIGHELAWVLIVEMFGWRDFRNRKEVGAFVGLVGTPYSSGGIDREQGISKSGSKVLRGKVLQLAWLWIYHQPGSKLTKWFMRRFADGGKRMRKVGIVAVARRLLVDLWHYLEQGRIPEGALLS